MLLNSHKLKMALNVEKNGGFFYVFETSNGEISGQKHVSGNKGGTSKKIFIGVP